MPRLNAFSYWLFLFGWLIVTSGFLTPGGAPDFGWAAYTPLSNASRSPGPGSDLWITGLIVAGLGTFLGGVNFITTIVCIRGPGASALAQVPIDAALLDQRDRHATAMTGSPGRGLDGRTRHPLKWLRVGRVATTNLRSFSSS